MSATSQRPPLDGFEERLLMQLQARIRSAPAAQIASAPAQPLPTTAPRRAGLRIRLPRPTLPVAAAVAALATGLLSLLPGAAPTLARTFPVLAGRAQALPVRLARVLRAQWRAGAGPRFDLRRAYAFHTPAGMGYVVLDRAQRWLCVLVPGFSANSSAGRCERVTLARIGDPPLRLRISAGAHRQEILALVPRGMVASTHAPAGATTLSQHGVLMVVTRGPVTVTTTIGHHSTSTTYRP